jgi:hypothetical protein
MKWVEIPQRSTRLNYVPSLSNRDSASFSPLVGPFTLRVGEEDLDWHTGEGGRCENSGIESLLFVFLKKLQEK